MKQQHSDYQVVPYPKYRRWMAAAFRSTHHKPMIHGLLEVDVSGARAFVRDQKARTGESLSFTAFLIACLAKAVDEHKAVLYRPFLWAFGWIGRRRPRLWKTIVGTVEISAVGMFGNGVGWGIPPAPAATLMLTVGGIGEKQVVVDGHVAVQEYLSLTISFDHDIIDGAPAARFTRRLKELIESGYGLGDSTAESEPAGADGMSTQQVEATRPALP
jgi:pyruvate/2-oxoglutarate dehydrogenase complex dihydrolipoamide acyltransferase (E2) component